MRPIISTCIHSYVTIPVAGFSTIHILPHVDPVDSSGKGMWRNVVKFDPLAKVGPSGHAFSYEDVSGALKISYLGLGFRGNPKP